MQISQNIRYKPYQDWPLDAISSIQSNMKKSPWQTVYHIEPNSGLLNDPNGFSYFDGKYHLFYQNWPFGAAHGLKQWVHMTSSDLVHFKETDTRLLPDHPHDRHGAYSGSAYAIDDRLFLFYTGNVRDESWERTPLQIGAFMDKQGKIEKCQKVLIEQPEDVSEHFRDPQIFNYKGNFYTIVGAQSRKKKGFVKLYQAKDNNIKHWTFVGNLEFGGTGSEYMIECPNLIFIKDKPVLLYCPQGLDKAELNYDNIYPNAYKIGQSFDMKKAELIDPSSIYNLDYGFECYATQAFNAPDGRVLAISWIGLPDIDYPTDHYDYQGALSLVKELTLKDDKLYQYPVSEMKNLRQSCHQFSNQLKTDNCYELELTIPKDSTTELVLFSDSQHKGLHLLIDTANELFTLDRSTAGEQYALDFGTKRSCQLANQETTLNIFVDKSIIEIFINKGEKVLTSRVFPKQDQTGIILKKGEITGSYFPLGI